MNSIVLIVILNNSDSNTHSRSHNHTNNNTPSLPIKSLDFRGFDPSKLLILRGGNYHVR